MMTSPDLALVAPFDTVTAVAAAALTTNYFLQTRYNPDLELLTELLCWIGLALAIHTYSRFNRGWLLDEVGYQDVAHYPKAIAGAIVLATLCKSVEDARWIMVRHLSTTP